MLAGSWPVASGLGRRGVDPSVNSPLDKGTFQDPSVHVRPKFRYWIPDASVDPAIAANDVRAAGSVADSRLPAWWVDRMKASDGNGFHGFWEASVRAVLAADPTVLDD